MRLRPLALLLVIAVLAPLACVGGPGTMTPRVVPPSSPASVSAAPAASSARARRPMQPRQIDEWGCGHYSHVADNAAVLISQHPRSCWAERGCPEDAYQHPAPRCPDLPAVRIRDLVDEPTRIPDRTKVVVRGTLALGPAGSAMRERACGSWFAYVRLEELIDGACYVAPLTEDGLGCPADWSRACCGDLPMGEDVAFVAEYRNYSGDGPFHVELVYASLCTMPGETIRRPKR